MAKFKDDVIILLMIMMMILVNFMSFPIVSIFVYSGHSFISHLHIICCNLLAEIIYDRELDNSLFNPEKP